MEAEMNQEIVSAEIAHYTSLLRIKNSMKEVKNKQLEIEIKTSKATLKTFGVDVSQFDFLIEKED